MAALFVAAGLLSPNFGLAIWMLIAFTIVFVVLSKFAFPAMLGGLKEREETIQSSLEQAERANAEAKRLLADNESARREAEAQAQAILRDARDQATAQREADVAKTKAEIARMQAAAQADIETQKQQALAELRSEVADLAVRGAEAILNKQIDAEAQRGLVDQFISDLPQN